MNQRAAVCCVGFSFAAALATYIASAPLGPGTWDTAELQTVPYILGIAHPTGFPFYTLAGWLFTHLFVIGSVAWRMNVLSGLCVAAAAGAVSLIAVVLGAGVVEAVLGSLLFAWCSAVWNKGSHADPHAMSLMFVMLVLAFAVLYVRRGAAWSLLAACLCGGLGLATHPEVLYSLPAIAVAFFVRNRPSLRVIALAAAALVLPLAFYAYLPLRSAYVVAHQLDPNAAPPISGTVPSELDANHASTHEGFIDEVSGRQFGASNAMLTLFDFAKYPAAFAYWWQQSYAQIPPFAIVLGGIGAICLFVRDWRQGAVVFAGTFGVLPFVYAFKAVEGDPNRYFLPSFALMAALAATSSRFAIPRTDQSARSIFVSVVLFGAVALQWMDNSGALHGRTDSGGQGTIDTVRRDIPDGAIVVAIWVDATPLEYAEFVDRSMGSRVIVPGWPGEFADRYAAWEKVKPVYIFADPHAMDNIHANFAPKSFSDAMSSDGYHHIVRIQHTAARTSEIAPVLLFTGTGSSSNDVAAIETLLSGSHIGYSTVSSLQLNGLSESQLATYRLLIVPGGDFVELGNSLTAATVANVHNAVKGGLNYLGICAGGFLAGHFPAPYKSFDLTSGVKFGFYSAEKNGTRRAVVRMSSASGPALDQYWEDGPQLSGWGDVVAKYPDGTPAIAEGPVGRGWAILAGVHVEAPATWRRGMVFGTPVSENAVYARALIIAALNGTRLRHY